MIYQDFDISGTVSDRPEYQKMLNELEEFDNIIVYEFSRLWRDLEEQSRTTKTFMKNYVTVVSVSDGDINPDGDTLVADIKGSVNQHEVRRLRKRTRDGIAAKKARVAAGLDEWKPRGKDKTKRSNEGYLKRWAKHRGEII
jgi:DNA invertase Pin-like site-specific DNA recombinase